MKNKMKLIARTILAVLTFLSYRGEVVTYTPTKLEYRTIARWYSPLFYLIVVILIVPIFIFGGFLKVRDMMIIVKRQFDKNSPVTKYRLHKSVKLSKFDKFILIYG